MAICGRVGSDLLLNIVAISPFPVTGDQPVGREAINGYGSSGDGAGVTNIPMETERVAGGGPEANRDDRAFSGVGLSPVRSA